MAGLLHRLVDRAGLSTASRQIQHPHIAALGPRENPIRPVGGAVRHEENIEQLLRIVQLGDVLQLRGKMTFLVVRGDDER